MEMRRKHEQSHEQHDSQHRAAHFLSGSARPSVRAASGERSQMAHDPMCRHGPLCRQSETPLTVE